MDSISHGPIHGNIYKFYTSKNKIPKKSKNKINIFWYNKHLTST